MKRSNGKANVDWRRAGVIGALTFTVAVVLALPSRGAMSSLDLPLAILTLAIIILIGIAFDVIGVATAAAEEAPFHAMAAADRPGARHALWIVRNAGAVVSFCNDVVGDVAGTLSGAAGAAIVLRLLAMNPAMEEGLLSVLVLAFIAALTVGGKAAGKSFAINHATHIVHTVGRVLYVLDRVGLIRLRLGRPRRPGRANGRGG